VLLGALGKSSALNSAAMISVPAQVAMVVILATAPVTCASGTAAIERSADVSPMRGAVDQNGDVRVGARGRPSCCECPDVGSDTAPPQLVA